MKPKSKLNFGVIVGSRGFFNPKLATEGRTQLLGKLKKMGVGAVILPENGTPNGAVETMDDAYKYAKLFNEKRESIDGIIISLPNFGDELGVVNTIREAKLDVPVLVQACDDEVDKVDVERRRDSFCGKLSVCNNLYQYSIPFTDTTHHTCAIQSDIFSKDIEFFSKVCRVVQGLRNARIGAIGTRPAAFQTMRFSEKLLQSFGITVVTVDLSEIIFAAQKMDQKAAGVKRKIDELKAYGKIPKQIPEENIVKEARLSVAMENWIKMNRIDACGVQCWTSIQQNYGCAACVSMSMLGEKLTPCACEVDVCGVIGMYALVLASGNPAALLDWNNNYGDDRNKCVCIHCSSYPKSFIGNKIEISNLDVLGASLGENNCFGGVKGKVAAGPMTFFRVSTDDQKGKIKSYLGEGEFTDDPFAMDGAVAVCNVPNLQQLMKYMCKNGFEHHVGMARSGCGDVIAEAVNTYLKWDLYHHK